MSGVDLGDDAAGADDLFDGCENPQSARGGRGNVVQGLADAHGGHGLSGPHARAVRHEPLLQDASGSMPVDQSSSATCTSAMVTSRVPAPASWRF